MKILLIEILEMKVESVLITNFIEVIILIHLGKWREFFLNIKEIIDEKN